MVVVVCADGRWIKLTYALTLQPFATTCDHHECQTDGWAFHVWHSRLWKQRAEVMLGIELSAVHARQDMAYANGCFHSAWELSEFPVDLRRCIVMCKVDAKQSCKLQRAGKGVTQLPDWNLKHLHPTAVQCLAACDAFEAWDWLMEQGQGCSLAWIFRWVRLINGRNICKFPARPQELQDLWEPKSD